MSSILDDQTERMQSMSRVYMVEYVQIDESVYVCTCAVIKYLMLSVLDNQT